MVKRYAVLVGPLYYPNGWDDFVGTCETVEEAKTLAVTVSYEHCYPWAEIIDLTTCRLVCATERGEVDKLNDWEEK